MKRCILITALLVVGCAGCGDTRGTPPAPAESGGNTGVPPPRPGEDVMKEQMSVLQKKGLLSKVPGVLKNK